MKIERLDRVALDVKNLDEAVNLFSDVFGTIFQKLPKEPKLEIIIAGHGDQLLERSEQLKIAVSPIGLELIESVPTLEKEGVRCFHFKVPDLEEAKAEMNEKGIRLLTEIRLGRLKEAIFSSDDLHGARVVLAEYEGASMLDSILGKGEQ